MATNFLIGAVAVVVLAMLGLLTMINGLNQLKGEMLRAWDELEKLFVRRRDMVPYLLESARIQSPQWENLKKWRTALMRDHIPMEEREELEDKLQNAAEALIAEARQHDDVKRDTGFLEVEKDIRNDIIVEITEAQKVFETANKEYTDKLRRFPYSVAAMFSKKH